MLYFYNNKKMHMLYISQQVWNGLHLYIAFTNPLATKALYICLTFTHSLIHSHTGSGVSHARRHPARWEQLGLGVLLTDTGGNTWSGD